MWWDICLSTTNGFIGINELILLIIFCAISFLVDFDIYFETNLCGEIKMLTILKRRCGEKLVHMINANLSYLSQMSLQDICLQSFMKKIYKKCLNILC